MDRGTSGLQSVGLQRVEHDLLAKLQQQQSLTYSLGTFQTAASAVSIEVVQSMW